MRVAIIGAGFTGLSAAYDLAKMGHQVKIFEVVEKPGGLAGGFLHENWQWPLEDHYHHVFETDKELKKWLKELGLSDQLFFKSTNTFTLTDSGCSQLDSPVSLLAFPNLSLLSKIRTGLVLAFLKVWPWGKVLERFMAHDLLEFAMGTESRKKLWKPLFIGKFGKLAREINAAWFWARIFARSKKLGYFVGGFQGLANQVEKKLKKMGVSFRFKTQVMAIVKKNDGWLVQLNKNEKLFFDKVLFTGNSKQLKQLVKDNFSSDYQSKLNSLHSLSAMTLVLVMNKPFLKDEIYWLNINRLNWPFLCVVEHTNYINKKHYGNEQIVYVGKYLSENDPTFLLSKKQLLDKYDPYLKEICPDYKDHLSDYYLFKARYAQPVVKKNHSKHLPDIKTSLEGLYFAGMEQVYPFDRGINYAVKIGREAAKKIV